MLLSRVCFAGALLYVGTLAGCPAPITAPPCTADLDCPMGQFCGATSTCVFDCAVAEDCRATHGAGAFCDGRGRCAAAIDGGHADPDAPVVLDAPADVGSDSPDAGPPTWREEDRLFGAGGAMGDLFGFQLALSADGTRALVGVHRDDSPATDAGSARVFRREGSNWVEETTLVATGGAADDTFGYSVALNGDGTRAIVGVYGDDTTAGADAGSARVFSRSGTTWTEEATLVPMTGAAPGDWFGISVSMSEDGSRALIGAYPDNSAYVFVRSGSAWSQEASLTPADGAGGDRFGTDVELSADGSRAIIGADGDSTAGGSAAGSARVFHRTGTTWAAEATLLATGGAAGDHFGQSVAFAGIDGATALVGAIYDDTSGGVDAGSARVFRRTGTSWAEEALPLLAGDGSAMDFLGCSVALSADGTRALVGASNDQTTGGAGSGSTRVFFFDGSDWTEERTLVPSDASAMDVGGQWVALSADGHIALSGSTYDDTPAGMDAGSATVYVLSP